jgi:arsenate reductase
LQGFVHFRPYYPLINWFLWCIFADKLTEQGCKMELYGLKNCDSCRNAIRQITASGQDITLIDVRIDGVSPTDLARFYAEFGAALVNTRSTTWRGLSDAERAQPHLELLTAHPTLMKRPVIDTGTKLTLGWTKDIQAMFQ